MGTPDLEKRWQQEVALVLTGVKEWRLQHPRASLDEIEAALDERWASARARLLQDLALVSAAAHVAASERDESAPPAGPAVQQLSADGALVPLLRKEWT